MSKEEGGAAKRIEHAQKDTDGEVRVYCTRRKIAEHLYGEQK